MNYKESITINNLRSARKTFGLRQQDVAEILGFNISDRISHWEKGTAVPSIFNLFRLSSLYGIPPQELYPSLMKSINDETIEKLKAKYPQFSSSWAK